MKKVLHFSRHLQVCKQAAHGQQAEICRMHSRRRHTSVLNTVTHAAARTWRCHKNIHVIHHSLFLFDLLAANEQASTEVMLFADL